MNNNFIKPSKWVVGIFLLPTVAAAAIYQTIDSQGNRYFSDMPGENATRIHLKMANSYSMAPSNNSQTDEKKQVDASNEAQKTHQKFVLLQPINQQTFQNQHAITAQVQLEPGLQAGEMLQWWLDGKLQQQSTETQVVLEEVERGEHLLQVKLTPTDNQVVITTSPVNFYVHYAVSQKTLE